MWIPWAVAVMFAVVAAVLGFLYFRQVPPQKTVLRSAITLPDNTTNLHNFAISPNGRLVAIAAEVSGKRQLWLRPLNGLQAQPLSDTDNAIYPF